MVQALTVSQKQGIVREWQRRQTAGQTCTQSQLAQWGKLQFKLQQVPNQATISRVLKQSASLHSVTSHSTVLRKQRKAHAPSLERALFDWINEKNANGVQVSGQMVRELGSRLQTEANKTLPLSKQLNLVFSNGWIGRFQARHGLRYRRTHGESAGANMAAIAEQLPAIREKIGKFQECDVFNADEFGLFFRQPPGWSLSATQVNGLKKDKSRITCLACCNFSGTEKYPLMIIGHARRPRPFGKQSGKALGFDYYFNSKAWMTRELFFSWLERFNAYVSMTSGRRVLLLLDNCSAHGGPDVHPVLSNVELFFLPPNTTSHIQPMDAGIIAAVKAKFRRRLLFRTFDNIDTAAKAIYNLDILTAMRWVEEAWNSVDSTSIRNCWKHCFETLSERLLVNTTQDIETDLRKTVEEDMRAHSVKFTKIGVESLLNPANEDVVREEISFESLVASITQPESSGIKEDSEETEADAGIYSVKEQLHGLAVAKDVLSREGLLSEETEKLILDRQRALRFERLQNMRQTSIVDHFK